jgi:hypothetical protein
MTIVNGISKLEMDSRQDIEDGRKRVMCERDEKGG